MCLGSGCKCVCILGEEHHRPELAQLTEDRVLESPCWILESNPLVVPMGKQAQEGRDLPRILQLVGGTAKIQREQGHLGVSPSSAPPQHVTASFGKGIRTGLL